MLHVSLCHFPTATTTICLQGTLLILDEPTNHLDIPSKETLEEAVRQFEGAVIAVSHDRYFLKRIATRVLLVSECFVALYMYGPSLLQSS